MCFVVFTGVESFTYVVHNSLSCVLIFEISRPTALPVRDVVPLISFHFLTLTLMPKLSVSWIIKPYKHVGVEEEFQAILTPPLLLNVPFYFSASLSSEADSQSRSWQLGKDSDSFSLPGIESRFFGRAVNSLVSL